MVNRRSKDASLAAPVRWWQTISAQAVFLILAVSIGPLIVLGFKGPDPSTKRLLSEVQRADQEIARRGVENVESFVNGVEKELQATARGLGLQPAEAVQGEIQRALDRLPYVQSLTLVDSAGQEYLRMARGDAPPDKGPEDWKNSPELPRALQGEVVVGAVEGGNGPEPVIPMWIPLGEGSRASGVLVAQVGLMPLADRLAIAGQGWPGHLYLIGQDGALLIVSITDRGVSRVRVDMPQEMLEGKLAKYSNYSGAEVLGVAATSTTLGWHVIAERPAAEVLAPVNETRNRLIFDLLRAGGVAVALGLYFFLRITRPVRVLEEGARAFGQGQLQHRIPAHRNEIGRVATAFNDMAQALEKAQEHRLAAEQHARKVTEEANGALEQRARELETLNAQLESFNYSVAHDLRAPLRHIDGYSKILIEEHVNALDPQAQRYLERVRESTIRMGQLIDDLLHLSAIGRRELIFRETPLNQMVDSVLEKLRPDMEGRKIDWHIGKLPVVQCDPSVMEIALFNLLSNAVKYTRKQDQALIQMETCAKDGQQVVFVKDNGVGFDMKYANKLFGVFQRLHRQQEFEGTGIGLAIVKRVMDRHGWRIWAEAEPDKGAAFYFTVGVPVSPNGVSDGGEKAKEPVLVAAPAAQSS